MSDTPHPERTRRPSRSGVYERKEAAAIQREALKERLEHLDRGIAQVLERLGRIDDLRSDVRELRLLVEGINREIEREQKRLEKHGERLDALEEWRAEQRGERKARALVATGGGLAGGGFVAAGMEILRRLAGG